MEINGISIYTKARAENTMDVDGISVPINDEIALQPSLYSVSNGYNENTHFTLNVGLNSTSIASKDNIHFNLNIGLNSTSIASKDNIHFNLNIGLNSASISTIGDTFFSANLGFGGIEIHNANVSFWKLRNEFGQFNGTNGTITVESINGQYQIPTNADFFVLYPYMDINDAIIEHTVSFVSDDGIWSGKTTLIPTPNNYELQLYISTNRQNMQIVSFGSWNRALSDSEILHLHNNGNYNNPYNYRPIYNNLSMKDGMENWLQFQRGSFINDSGLKVKNLANGSNNASIVGYDNLNDIESNVTSKINRT